jgi:UDP-galactopyranose mutase
MQNFDILIVGAGLSGATIARQAAEKGVSVLVVDKRDHIAGNVYDYIDSDTGIRVSKYGAHLFHTNDAGVWDYVKQFGEWRRWDHRVVADISDCLVPIPVNINTVNAVFDAGITSSAEMDLWLSGERVDLSGAATNSEEVALSRVGKRLYDWFFKDYTVKQWAKSAADLEPVVLERIPVRNNFDDRYFSDKFQGLPVNGYTSIVEKMLDHPNITVRLNTDWATISEKCWSELVFTGPIDVYFKDKGLPLLEYRSIDFEWSKHECEGFYQQNSVVNYPSADVKYTRCVEYKHFLNQKSKWTIIAKETTSDNGEPYYPVPTKENRELYKKYADLAAEASGVHFVGRLASYKYFNMDQAIRNALDYFNTVLDPLLTKLKIETPSLVISELEKSDGDEIDRGLDGGAAEVVGKGVSEDEGRNISAVEA